MAGSEGGREVFGMGIVGNMRAVKVRCFFGGVGPKSFEKVLDAMGNGIKAHKKKEDGHCEASENFGAL